MPGQKGEFMFDQNKLKESVVCLALAFLFCAPAFAQQRADRQRKTSEQGRNDYGGEQNSRLTQEKQGRGAASGGEIGRVFVRDGRLVVGLKSLGAEEDKG